MMGDVQFEYKEKELYLASTECIDYKYPLVQEKVAELRKTAECSLDYRDNHPDLDSRLILILQNSFNVREIITDIRM